MLEVRDLAGSAGAVRGVLFLCLLGTHVAAWGACQFTVPEGWVQTSTRWDGDCRDGYADGIGVLKEYQGQEVKHLFLGRIKSGALVVGVIEERDGYLAGKFHKGRHVPSDDRQTVITAFAEAERAAKQAAIRYRKAGNTPSARFYEDKARQLGEQMD